jgi:hypothetical protein
MSKVAILILFALAVGACSGRTSGPGSAGRDASVDWSVDASVDDSPAIAGPDASEARVAVDAEDDAATDDVDDSAVDGADDVAVDQVGQLDDVAPAQADGSGDVVDAAAGDAAAGDAPADAMPIACVAPPRAHSWRPTQTYGTPRARAYHVAVWTGREMIVWGGQIAGTSPGAEILDGSRYDPVADRWTPMSTLGAPPPGVGRAAVWLESTREMMIWGGPGSADGGGLYSPERNAWRTPSLSDAPLGRFVPVMVSTGHDALVWCGRDGDQATAGDGMIYDPVADGWRPVASAGAPPCSSAQPSAWTGREFIVWGGNGTVRVGSELVGGVRTTQGGLYNPDTDSWRPLGGASPPGRWESSGVFGDGAFIVTGGFTSPDGELTNDGARYDVATRTWRILSATLDLGPVFPRGGGVWVGGGTLACGGAAVFWGGPVWQPGGSSTPARDGRMYFPGNNRWEHIDLTDAPTARSAQSVVSTGSSVIVWGGYSTSGLTATGAIYTP